MIHDMYVSLCTFIQLPKDDLSTPLNFQRNTNIAAFQRRNHRKNESGHGENNPSEIEHHLNSQDLFVSTFQTKLLCSYGDLHP